MFVTSLMTSMAVTYQVIHTCTCNLQLVVNSGNLQWHAYMNSVIRINSDVMKGDGLIKHVIFLQVGFSALYWVHLSMPKLYGYSVITHCMVNSFYVQSMMNYTGRAQHPWKVIAMMSMQRLEWSWLETSATISQLMKG